ncbi:MAG: thaumatin family protein [Gammaproteobacteria bacterium]|nr:thaumatin family protein [Gammaproteobacteria bacterium]
MLSSKKMMLFTLSIILTIFTAPIIAWAGTNPIGFSLAPSSGLPSSTTIGNSYSVLYTFTNNLPFAEPIKHVSHTVTGGGGFIVADHCAGKTLTASGGTCTAEVVFQPVQTGAASIQLKISYDNNVVPLPTLSTTAQSGATAEISGVVSQALPAQTIVNTGYTVTFTFTNNSASSITASSVTFTGNTGDFDLTSNGCTSALASNHSCVVTGTFTPSTTGSRSIGVTYAYSSGSKSVALTTNTTAANQGSGGCVSVNGSTDLLLPTQTYQYADNVVKFKFTNNCDTASATLGTVTLATTLNGATKSGWTVTDTNNDLCSGQTLAANASCYVTASVIPQATGSNLHVTATVPYTQSSQSEQTSAASTSNTVLPNDNTQRMITVINQCNVPVWMTFAAAAMPNSPTCTSDAQCTQIQPGSVCNVGAGLCYFSNPSLDGNHTFGLMAAAQLGAAPDTMNILISEDNSGTSPNSNTLYNAGIAGRLGCTVTGNPNNPLFCTANNCGSTVTPASGSTGSDGLCAPGIGPSNYPAMTFNAVEFTFLRNYGTGYSNVDGVYDQQNINGVNVPIEIKGRGPSTTSTVNTAPYNNCQPAGGPVQQTTGSTSTQLGDCSYSYSTPGGHRGSNYRFVTYTTGATDCTASDSSCSGTATDICGLTYNSDTGKIDKRCGSLIGYVSVNIAICAQSASSFAGSLGTTLQSEYNCNTSYTYSTGAQLYACSGTYAGQSCYNPLAGNPVASCCGCVDWWTSNGGSLPVPTSTGSCGIYVNPDWADPTGIVQSQIQWVKTACPTAYAFQYDDKSSQFTCTVLNSAQTKIVTNYQVTFCPGGKQISYVQP